jgi:hypothetical protein
MPTPAKPAAFTPEGVPVGVLVNLASYWQTRAVITPRIQLCHTNAASGQGSIESSKNWLESAPGVHTLPHYQVDRDGRACKFLPTNRKGIANQTVAAYRGTHGTVQDWSLAYETADSGMIADPTVSDYTDAQAETLATILAYESIVHGIPLEIPTEWFGSGTASHTDPFGYPYWTNAQGKTCPGAKKKARLRTSILPRSREIRAAWTAPTSPVIPPPSEDEEVKAQVIKGDGSPSYWAWSPAGVVGIPSLEWVAWGVQAGMYANADPVVYPQGFVDQLVAAQGPR